MSELFQAFGTAVGQLFTLDVFLALLFGTVFGWVFGIIPGLQPVTAMVVLLPFTFYWEPMTAMYVFAGIIGAVGQGGSITSILLNMPGAAQNAATQLEGYPLTQQGKAAYALGISASGSVLGSVISLGVLVMLLPIFIPFVLAFGPAEKFWIMVFGIAALSVAIGGNFIKGLISVGIGIVLATIGFGGPYIGVTRFTFGSTYLLDGLHIVIVIIGLLVISEALYNLVYRQKGNADKYSQLNSRASSLRSHWQEILKGIYIPFRLPGVLFRSSGIGILIGAIPGVGGVVAQFLSYNAAYASSRHPEKFGHGSEEGLLAAEGAVNAKDGGTLLPTFLFGIPGNGETALVLAAWQIHGLQVGPFFLQRHADLAWALILGIFIANVIASLMTIGTSFFLTRIPNIRVDYVAGGVLITSILAMMSIRQNFLDVALVLAVGLLGFLLKAFKFSVIGAVIGFILGDMMETNFYIALQSSMGSYSIFISSVISVVLIFSTVFVIAWDVYRKMSAKSVQNSKGV